MSGPLPNAYSKKWHETFLDSISPSATGIEVDFVARQLPVEDFPSLLDVCCGPGRHAGLLAGRGHRVLGVDVSEHAIARAREACPGASFQTGDMRSLTTLGGPFDGVINLWQSFGYFDDETNDDVLRQIRAVLRPGGRAIFDIYNLEHLAARPPEETAERGGRRIRTRLSRRGSRHRVSIEYDQEGVPGDEFEWRVYSPHEFRAICSSAGLETLVECAWFDESQPPAPENARMQFVVERPV